MEPVSTLQSCSRPVSQPRTELFTWIWRGALLLISVLSASTAVIMIKASTEHPFLIASFRLLLAAGILFPFFLRDLKKYRNEYTWKQVGWSVLPAAALALHFLSWVTGARMTGAANASLLVNLTPAVLPFFLLLFYREVVTKTEIIGTIFAIGGAILLSVSNFRADQTNFWGDLICFFSMLTYAAYIALGRKNGNRLSLWLYLVPLYSIAGILCLIIAAFFINPIKPYSLVNLLYIAGLAIVPTVIGHSMLNYSLKYFRGQIVGVANLGQPIFAGLMAFLIFNEVPSTTLYVSGFLVITGIVIVLVSQRNGKIPVKEN